MEYYNIVTHFAVDLMQQIHMLMGLVGGISQGSR